MESFLKKLFFCFFLFGNVDLLFPPQLVRSLSQTIKYERFHFTFFCKKKRENRMVYQNTVSGSEISLADRANIFLDFLFFSSYSLNFLFQCSGRKKLNMKCQNLLFSPLSRFLYNVQPVQISYSITYILFLNRAVFTGRLSTDLHRVR